MRAMRAILLAGAATLCCSAAVLAGHHEASEKKGTDKAKTLNAYFFGHSLVHHTDYKVPTPKDHTSIPFWLKRLSDAAGHAYTTDGQFGFLRNHAEFPPRAQWGFVNVESGWKHSFAQSKYDAVVLTAGNFVQYQGVDKPYYDDKNVSPLDATLAIVDYVQKESPASQIYIYENWPDMGEYAQGYPPKAPSKSKLEDYYRYTQGDFHNWWLDYHDRVIKARPQADVKLIPLGPILMTLLTETPLKNIPFEQLFEDNAPHGRPNIYFLAALIHYSALLREPAPKEFSGFDDLHPLIRQHYALVSNVVWQALQNAKDKSGKSRVW